MKHGALLVNVARAAVVDKQVRLTHLSLHRNCCHAQSCMPDSVASAHSIIVYFVSAWVHIWADIAVPVVILMH